MVTSRAKTVAQYLRELPGDRREAIAGVRKNYPKELTFRIPGEHAVGHDHLLHSIERLSQHI